MGDAIAAVATVNRAARIMLDRCEVEAARRSHRTIAHGGKDAVQVTGLTTPIEGGSAAAIVPIHDRLP
jgi:hypothetical protein